MAALGDVVDNHPAMSVGEDHTLPAPHDTLRMRYRFPQIDSTPEADGVTPRPFAKNQGPQGQAFYAANYHGGPQHTPTQLTFVSGLKKLGGLSGLGMLRNGFTPGDSGAIARRSALAGSAAVTIAWGTVVLASAGLSAYHGYKRNDDEWGPAVGWGLLGFIFPVITPIVALAQGFGERD